MSEELAGQALHDRAATLDIEGRSGMTADELRGAVSKAEKAQARAEAKALNDATGAEADVVQYDPTADSPQAAFTPPTPTTGVADTTRAAESNEPSSPNVELPANVHAHSGGAVINPPKDA